MHDKALNYVSLGKKGHNVIFGEETVGKACRAGTAQLIVLAQDAAENSDRRAKNAAGDRVPILPLPYTKEQLGAALGTSVCAMAAFTDAGLALAFVKALGDADQQLMERLEAAWPKKQRSAGGKKNAMEVAR